MNCPVCTVALILTERQGVEIDHCPRCRGVWLDRGELDKLIERSAGEPSYAPEMVEPIFDRDDEDDYRRRSGKGKRKSFLREMFDFD